MKHGQSETREYAAWTAMRERCSNPNAHNYHRYGARGIRVCERWDSYINFIADMGPRPKGHSIERIDNNGNYEPSNCKWATRLEQNRNKSNTFTAEEDQKIREAVDLGLNFRQMAEYVGRPEVAVQGRAYRIGLKSGQPLQVAARIFTTEEVCLIRSTKWIKPARVLAEEYGVSRGAIERIRQGLSYRRIKNAEPGPVFTPAQGKTP